MLKRLRRCCCYWDTFWTNTNCARIIICISWVSARYAWLLQSAPTIWITVSPRCVCRLPMLFFVTLLFEFFPHFAHVPIRYYRRPARVPPSWLCFSRRRRRRLPDSLRDHDCCCCCFIGKQAARRRPRMAEKKMIFVSCFIVIHITCMFHYFSIMILYEDIYQCKDWRIAAAVVGRISRQQWNFHWNCFNTACRRFMCGRVAPKVEAVVSCFCAYRPRYAIPLLPESTVDWEQ